MLSRQVLNVTTTIIERNSKVIISRTITAKIASDCRTLFDMFVIFPRFFFSYTFLFLFFFLFFLFLRC